MRSTQTTSHRLGLVTIAVAIGLIAAPSAQAFYVSGQQFLVNERAGKFRMAGDLNGKWKFTKFRIVQRGSVFKAKGEERFNGCVDLARDGSCSGDPSGKLIFRFRFWARLTDDGLPELATCAHRIVDATDGLAGTTGFLMMVDTPTASAPGFKTHYEGEINLPGSGGSSKAPVTPC